MRLPDPRPASCLAFMPHRSRVSPPVSIVRISCLVFEAVSVVSYSLPSLITADVFLSVALLHLGPDCLGRGSFLVCFLLSLSGVSFAPCAPVKFMLCAARVGITLGRLGVGCAAMLAPHLHEFIQRWFVR